MAQDARELLQYVREELKQLSEEGCDTWEMERRAALVGKDDGPDQLRNVAGDPA